MKVWGKLWKNNRIICKHVETVPEKNAEAVRDWHDALGKLCEHMDLSRPIILDKHVSDFNKFSRACFYSGDFIEPVDFDKLEIELF